jgi:hypothetical protein
MRERVFRVLPGHATHEGIDGGPVRDTSQSFRHKLDIHNLVRIVSH